MPFLKLTTYAQCYISQRMSLQSPLNYNFVVCSTYKMLFVLVVITYQSSVRPRADHPTTDIFAGPHFLIDTGKQDVLVYWDLGMKDLLIYRYYYYKAGQYVWLNVLISGTIDSIWNMFSVLVIFILHFNILKKVSCWHGFLLWIH